MRYSSVSFLGYAVITLISYLQAVLAEGGVACKDLQGESYESGYHYIPGPEPCTFCICDNGNPKGCQGFICKLPEEDCKSFRRGDTCCEFICLDNTLSSISNEKSDGVGGNITDGTANYDLGLRLIASFVTAMFSLSLLFFFIHRLRQRKTQGRQSRQLTEDQRSLNSMGYLERGGLMHGVPMDDIQCGGGYPLWKPPGNYFPRGEAPPPYEEAVAAARAEQALLSMSPHMLNFTNNYLPNHNNQTNLAVVASNQRSLTSSSPNLLNDNNASTLPLLPPTNRPLSSPNAYKSYHQSNHSGTSGGLNGDTCTTSFTIGPNIYENLPPPGGFNINSIVNANILQPPVLSNSHTAIPKSYHKPQHTTLPRQSGAFTISATLTNTNMPTHRTIPRTLTRSEMRMREMINVYVDERLPLPFPPRNKSPQGSSRGPPPIHTNNEELKVSNIIYKDTANTSLPKLEERLPEISIATKLRDLKPPLKLANEMNEDGSFDSVTCTCSAQALPTLHDDGDDYRSECENCKSATGSRYYLDNEDDLVTSPHETMTLHRRLEESTSSAPPQYYRTSLTLPISTRQRTRSTGIRENWFSTVPQSSTESSDEN